MACVNSIFKETIINNVGDTYGWFLKHNHSIIFVYILGIVFCFRKSTIIKWSGCHPNPPPTLLPMPKMGQMLDPHALAWLGTLWDPTVVGSISERYPSSKKKNRRSRANVIQGSRWFLSREMRHSTRTPRLPAYRQPNSLSQSDRDALYSTPYSVYQPTFLAPNKHLLHPTNHYPPCPVDARGYHPSTRDSMQQAAAKNALFDGPASHYSVYPTPLRRTIEYISKCVNRRTTPRMIGDIRRLIA